MRTIGENLGEYRVPCLENSPPPQAYTLSLTPSPLPSPFPDPLPFLMLSHFETPFVESRYRLAALLTCGAVMSTLRVVAWILGRKLFPCLITGNHLCLS